MTSKLTWACPAFTNNDDLDQLASEEANWSGSALLVIMYVNLYQQHGMSCIRWVEYRALRYAMVRYQKASWRFETVFGADSLSETERCIATRQNKMAAPDEVSARFKN